MFVGDHLISEANWSLLQRSNHTNSQVLDVWLRRPKGGDPLPFLIPHVPFGQAKTMQHGDKDLKNTKTPEPGSLSSVSVVVAFLGWPALDASGRVDKQPMLVRVGLLLNNMYKSIATRPADNDSNFHQIILSELYEPDAQGKLWIRGRSEEESCRIYNSFGTNEFLKNCRRILRAFVPSELGSHHSKFGVIQVFWGAVYELVVSSDRRLS